MSSSDYYLYYYYNYYDIALSSTLHVCVCIVYSDAEEYETYDMT